MIGRIAAFVVGNQARIWIIGIILAVIGSTGWYMKHLIVKAAQMKLALAQWEASYDAITEDIEKREKLIQQIEIDRQQSLEASAREKRVIYEIRDDCSDVPLSDDYINILYQRANYRKTQAPRSPLDRLRDTFSRMGQDLQESHDLHDRPVRHD